MTEQRKILCKLSCFCFLYIILFTVLAQYNSLAHTVPLTTGGVRYVPYKSVEALRVSDNQSTRFGMLQTIFLSYKNVDYKYQTLPHAPKDGYRLIKKECSPINKTATT